MLLPNQSGARASPLGVNSTHTGRSPTGVNTCTAGTTRCSFKHRRTQVPAETLVGSSATGYGGELGTWVGACPRLRRDTSAFPRKGRRASHEHICQSTRKPQDQQQDRSTLQGALNPAARPAPQAQHSATLMPSTALTRHRLRLAQLMDGTYAASVRGWGHGSPRPY